MESENWLSSVQNELSAAQRSRNAPPRPLPKVLADMRRRTVNPYEPIFFTFGPYHAKLTKPLSPCDHFKLQAAKALTSTQTFSSLVAEIQERDSYIRDVCAEPWDNSPDLQEPVVLAHLLALDALSIAAAAWNPQVFQFQAIASAVLRDAFLLGQQIPLFVLKCAVKSIYNGRGPSLETIVKAFAKEVSSFCPFSPSQFEKSFQSSWPNWSEPSNIHEPTMICCVYDILTSNNTEISSSDPACSITRNISLSTAEDPPAEEAQKGFPTAAQLLGSGICTFEGSDAPFGGFRGINFDKGKRKLTLPRITVYANTPSYLLNLAAYEIASCPPRNEHPVSAYIKFMDYLINKGEDVKLLETFGVIRNEVGTHAKLASNWNDMALCLPPTIYTTEDTTRTINKINHTSQRKWYVTWHKWKKNFCEKYWNKQPWLIFSIIAAFFLLALTCLQTVYTIKLYYLR